MDMTLEVAMDGDVTMGDVESEPENSVGVEEEQSSPEAAREPSIVRALLASERRPRPVGDWLEKEISGKIFKLGKNLDDGTQEQIAKVIGKHLDAFAWSASDMPGIDPDFLCHRLAMDPQVRPVRQRRRKFNEERRQAIRDETQKTPRGEPHQGDTVPGMASQCRVGKEEQREMANVCGLYRSK